MGDCDLCIGSRYVKDAGVINWPIWREILSRSANVYVKLITRMPVGDGTGGFKCYRRSVLEAIDLMSETANITKLKLSAFSDIAVNDYSVSTAFATIHDLSTHLCDRALS